MGKTAFLLAGQGSQYPGMGKELYESSKAVREIFDEAEKIRPGTLRQMFEGSDEELKRTANTQPCLFLADIAAAVSLKENGVAPDMIAGFSLGEVAGLALSGIMDEMSAFRLVIKRGLLMDEAAKRIDGGMLAVLRMDAGELEEMCKEIGVYPVNYNCPGQIVVSGTAEKISELQLALSIRKIRCISLAVSGPFHTPYMKSASNSLRDELLGGGYFIRKSDTDIYSNRLALAYPEEKGKIIDLISAQISNSVRWEETLRNMVKAGADTFIECGPGNVLSGFVKRTCPEAKILNVSDRQTLGNALEALKYA
jgi:[acyl-carrier-protein] S-malonyltransferase